MKSAVAILLAVALGVSMPGIVATSAVAAPQASSTPAPTESPDGGSTEAAAPVATPDPSAEPTLEPSPEPEPTLSPEPTSEPSAEPTTEPTPTEQPNSEPTPTTDPTPSPTPTPTDAPITEAPVAPESDAPAPQLYSEVQTLAAGSFNPAAIISDFNFFNSWAMTEDEIQAFLERQIDAQGGCQNSNCLAAFRMNTPNASWSFGTCAPYSGASGESAARIIYRVQRLCGLSAKVILVTLQKEQGLITSQSPSDGVMRKAMGMGCPDTSVCDSQFYGFFNQVYAAARQLLWYTNPGSSMYQGGRFRVGQPRPIQFNPNAACGSSSVTIQNLATSALYFYTPYQPNANSLAAGWGASWDGCASYGNRNFSLYYNAWFGNPNSTSPIPTTRLGGNDRYETAVAISQDTYKSAGVPVVYVASGSGFADALSAAPAAATQGGPLLLVAQTAVPYSTLAELKRLKPKNIVIVGGTGVVTAQVAKALSAIAPVKRIAGADRFETSQLIAATVFPAATSAFLATGWDFADALSAGAAAGASKTPVLLVDGKARTADEPTLRVLRTIGVTKITLAGGTGAISHGIAVSLKSAGATVVRRAGLDRYATSVAINTAAFGSSATAYVAAGMAFPDALAGAAAAAKSGMPLYLSYRDCLPKAVRESITAKGAKRLVVLGGTGAMTDRVRLMMYC
ncbi:MULTISPECIES: cell wall-binding repeat-containing protein [unclassified Leifsonia]|uniref:cell wall-binding repeat-containing protein n=1 Tax=unclassified Leifsonia TaxID=2663824 RepID=UPI0006F3768A|nr:MULTISPECIES: cell wall-binding repeat-containing protein [unclassified Leifsonia]KQX06378.1 hypothetical protein ASC59_00400 [Leifsonia sp. Root1293]KRA10662.1 hypothetical protein ASD61_00400 [Leifsonia sp. Root60]